MILTPTTPSRPLKSGATGGLYSSKQQKLQEKERDRAGKHQISCISSRVSGIFQHWHWL